MFFKYAHLKQKSKYDNSVSHNRNNEYISQEVQSIISFLLKLISSIRHTGTDRMDNQSHKQEFRSRILVTVEQSKDLFIWLKLFRQMNDTNWKLFNRMCQNNTKASYLDSIDRYSIENDKTYLKILSNNFIVIQMKTKTES